VRARPSWKRARNAARPRVEAREPSLVLLDLHGPGRLWPTLAETMARLTVWTAEGRSGAPRLALRAFRPPRPAQVVERGEWDVALESGGVFRLFHDRLRDRWCLEGELD
jgi:hypothetical protein